MSEADARKEAMRIPGVVGATVKGKTLYIDVENEAARSRVPQAIMGLQTSVRVTGPANTHPNEHY